MPLLIEIETTQPPGVSDRNHRKFMRDALKAAAVEHLLKRLPKHFQNVPENRPGGAYGYVAPTKKHMIRKARKFGHQIPNVFTGLERLHVLANSRVTANFRQSKVVIRGLHPKSQEQGRRWRETVAAIADSERPKITQTGHDVYQRDLNQHLSQRQRQSFK